MHRPFLWCCLAGTLSVILCLPSVLTSLLIALVALSLFWLWAFDIVFSLRWEVDSQLYYWLELHLLSVLVNRLVDEAYFTLIHDHLWHPSVCSVFLHELLCFVSQYTVISLWNAAFLPGLHVLLYYSSLSYAVGPSKVSGLNSFLAFAEFGSYSNLKLSVM